MTMSDLALEPNSIRGTADLSLIRPPSLVPVPEVPEEASATTGVARARVQTGAKRTLDIVGALVLIVLTLPTMLLVAAAVFITDPGPVVFRQRRLARDGGSFRIWKFRTMVVDAEERLHGDPALYRQYLENHHKLPAHIDPRITRVGRLLRSTSLDELPQLFNVLAGSMSLVGPRPVLRSELLNYGAGAEQLLSVRPGMTGLWQVSGRSRVGYPERAEIDLDYASRWTIGMDIGILLRTVVTVGRRTGAG